VARLLSARTGGGLIFMPELSEIASQALAAILVTLGLTGLSRALKVV
jgi:hypothetical protein